MKSQKEMASFSLSEDKTPLLKKEKGNKSVTDSGKESPRRTSYSVSKLWASLNHPENNDQRKNELRKRLTVLSIRLNDFAVLLGIIGILLMILDTENLIAEIEEFHTHSIILRSCITGTTVLLLFTLIFYHAIDMRLYMIKNNIASHRLVFTWSRKLSIAAELLICALHIPPGMQAPNHPQLFYFQLDTVELFSICCHVVTSRLNTASFWQT